MIKGMQHVFPGACLLYDIESPAMFWSNIHNDENVYYIKDLGLFFKMLHIDSYGRETLVIESFWPEKNNNLLD